MPKIRQKINRKKDCFLEYKRFDFNYILMDSPYMFNNKNKDINMNKQEFYMRDHNKAFDNAKAKGLHDPEAYMYMYSKTVDGKNQDFFKNINFRNYIKFEQ